MGRWGATAIFDLYWQFAVDRQQVLIRRLAGASPPWTDDPIIAQYRFTNPYRFSDRVSQHLLRSVQHDQPRRTPTNIVFRTLLFRVFNRIDTWDSLVAAVGEPTIESFDPVRYGRVLAELRGFGQRIYSPAYIVPNPPFGAPANTRTTCECSAPCSTMEPSTGSSRPAISERSTRFCGQSPRSDHS
jgi:hypothetical protein